MIRTLCLPAVLTVLVACPSFAQSRTEFVPRAADRSADDCSECADGDREDGRQRTRVQERRRDHDQAGDNRFSPRDDRRHHDRERVERRFEERSRIERRESSGLNDVTPSVDAEMRDIARALRSLDQSYMYKGFRNGNHAWVAGSSFLQRRCDETRVRALEDRLRALELRLREERRESRVEVDCRGFAWRAGEELRGKLRGRAAFEKNGALHLVDGAFLVGGDAADLLVRDCMATNELTLQAVFEAASDDCEGPARIVSLSTDTSKRNLTLGQVGDRLVLRLRTTENDENGTNPEIALVRIRPGVRYHLAVTYEPGRLVCYLDGKQVLETGALRGTFRNWTRQRLVLGDEVTGDRDWPGTLSRFAIHNCVMVPEQR